MRGKGPFCGSKAEYEGITPAYAGKRYSGCSIFVSSGDHPRLCGEKRNCVKNTGSSRGSPPPMRGKEFSCFRSHGLCRITPAYAGKRFFRCSAMHRRRDHPRLCGEKSFPLHGIQLKAGSPPPMRGKGLNLQKSNKIV